MRASWIILACWISGGALASAQSADNAIADEKVPAEQTTTETASESLDQLNESGFSRLHYLAMQNKPIEAAALISEGADVNVRQGTFHGTPLQYAANKGHTAIVKLLIVSDAELDAKDTFGRTPLMWAAQAGHARVVKQLIDAGADVNAKTRTGWTPLKYARKAEDSVSEKLLLEAGAKTRVDPADPAEPPEPPRAPRVATVPTAAHAMFSKPDPFLSLAPESKQQVEWEDVRPTEMKVDVDVSILAQRKDGNVALPITIYNRTDKPIRVRLTKEWHGGEWPSTDLYASVSRAGVERMASFVPVYLAGESDRDEPAQKIRPGKSKQVWLRMDWPGTGSVRAEPLMAESKGSRYLISVMMLFDVGDQKQYTVSKLTYVGSPELVEVANVDSPSGDVDKPSEQEIADRLRRFRDAIDYLSIPANSLPVGYRSIPSLPAVVLPDVSATEDEYFKVASAFVASSAPERTRMQAAIVIGFQAGDAKIGVYALRCGNEADARALSRAGLITKGKLLMYVWDDGADEAAVEQVRSYYAGKAFR